MNIYIDSYLNLVDRIIEEEMQPIDNEIIETTVYHWDITNWSQLEERALSPVIKAAGYQWNILLFPRGNHQMNFISAYLDLKDVKDPQKAEEYVCAQFIIAISRPSDPTVHMISTANHRFTVDESDWGFTRFLPIQQLMNEYLEDDAIRVTAIIRAVKDETGILWHNFQNYDSKKVTGYVGLQNQGATCYMNSLFQSLYFTNSFRKAVYQIPTENDEPTKSIALALQRVFYNLQFSSQAVGTTELTKSFGWDSLEAFRQHDVQEFNRVLQDNLEIKMKNTPADGAIKRLFVGKMKSYIKCINVDYESSRSEDYYDIQLNVKGCKNLEESFKDYVTEETLEGVNKYMAEGHGLQDAKKGVIFESFPPVLHLQLKRFEYDMYKDMMVKINDRHEFPTEIDLEPYLSEDADKSQGHKYHLHGVLVHSGDLSGGHYFAFVKPEIDGKWFKFDDDRVIPATLKEVLEENYGGEQQGLAGIRPNNNRLMHRFTNAYMLVYIRESMINEILAPVTKADIPTHLAERLEEEARLRELRRREKEEQHLYLKTFIVTDETFLANTGFDFANFADKDTGEKHIVVSKVRKDQPFADFVTDAAENLKVAPSDFRFWLMVNRQNRTVRIDVPIPVGYYNSTMDEIRAKYATSQLNLRLYLERASMFDENNHAIFPAAPPSSSVILVFIKLYNPELQKIQGIGKMYCEKEAKVAKYISGFKQLAQFPDSEEILVYEEIKNTMIESVNIDWTFNRNELQDGDILCIQKTLSLEEREAIVQQGGKPTVDQYLQYEAGRISVSFAPLVSAQPQPVVAAGDDDIKNNSQQDSPEFRLSLHRDMTYEEMIKAVAKELDADASKLRLVSPYAQQQYGRYAYKRYAGQKLSKIIQQNFPSNGGIPNRPKFLYEKLEMTLAEMEAKCPVTVTICFPTMKDANVVELLMPKDSNLNDLKEALVAKGAQFGSTEENVDLNHIRIWDAVDGRFGTEYDDRLWQPCINARPFMNVYAERIPDEEFNLVDQQYAYMPVFHFHRIPSHTHSVPFKFFVIPSEPIGETKKRLQARTGLDDNEWSKVKLHIVNEDDNSTTLVNDDDSTEFYTLTHYSSDMIGLDHVDKTSKIDKTGAIFIRG
ncbi:hypothetical protein BDF20DRAFT_906363 [Mycotypha africana]|uniref:uncharacterized protein n=1 Tax=Mycotypha africana TaxID=64632 RepID=UPI0023007E5E|nr:uncharacterized protein BDF20DRAFT_906363 [Mycotypha africana]KAI8977181.1 hypothetical protein BDF20DRAFT_906363 [Mycotypha africana]